MAKKPARNTPLRLKAAARQDFDSPDWAPILALVGTKLTSWFMWMGAITLTDGTVLHAYKHRDTRCYIHTTAEGRTFIYDWDGTLTSLRPHDYVEVDRYALLLRVFRDWDTSRLEFEEPNIRRELDRMFDAADRDVLLPVDPNELRLQREYEAREGRAA